MNKATVTIAAILLGGSLAPHLAAQPAVEELERKLRQEQGLRLLKAWTERLRKAGYVRILPISSVESADSEPPPAP